MWTLVSSLPFILFYCVRGLIRISTDYTQVGPASPWKMCNSTNNRTENVDFLRSVKINSRKCDSRAVFGSDLYLLGSEKQYFSFLSPVPPECWSHGRTGPTFPEVGIQKHWIWCFDSPDSEFVTPLLSSKKAFKRFIHRLCHWNTLSCKDFKAAGLASDPEIYSLRNISGATEVSNHGATF